MSGKVKRKEKMLGRRCCSDLEIAELARIAASESRAKKSSPGKNAKNAQTDDEAEIARLIDENEWITYTPTPTQKEVEAWLVARRKKVRDI